jgi:hypothetical protein
MKLSLPSVASLALVAALATAQANAACTYPKAPDSIPDGNTAALEEMVAAQKAVKQFDTDVGAYQTCIEKELNDSLAKDAASLTEQQKQERSKIANQKIGAAGEEISALAARLNEQIRAFKAKSAAAKK